MHATRSALALLAALLAAPARADVDVVPVRIDGTVAPDTPTDFNKVGILQIGPAKAKNVLVLVPGTSASAAYFVPVAKTIVERAPGWQVWAVERRENQLEDHSVLDEAKDGTVTGQQLFDYYLGWIANPAGIPTHFNLIPDDQVAYARGWGMRVAVEDLDRVIDMARQHRRRVVLGGHSLGGTITTAYATWDFGGKAGARKLRGLVYIDGGSSPTAVSASDAMTSLQALDAGSPWLSFGGINAPFAGLFNSTGSMGCFLDPDAPSLGQAFPYLPADLKPPVPVTNLGQYGYALDNDTSPPSLIAAQAHLGRLATSGDPRGWDQAGELTPILRYAEMFSGKTLKGYDGTAWYHPLRLTIDGGAVGNGLRNDAQDVLDVRAIHSDDLPKRLRIYAFGAQLGGQRVLDAATALAKQSKIPRKHLVLIDRHDTYSHNDPNGAFPDNAFLDGLVPFLKRVGRR